MDESCRSATGFEHISAAVSRIKARVDAAIVVRAGRAGSFNRYLWRGTSSGYGCKMRSPDRLGPGLAAAVVSG